MSIETPITASMLREKQKKYTPPLKKTKVEGIVYKEISKMQVKFDNFVKNYDGHPDPKLELIAKYWEGQCQANDKQIAMFIEQLKLQEFDVKLEVNETKGAKKKVTFIQKLLEDMNLDSLYHFTKKSPGIIAFSIIVTIPPDEDSISRQPTAVT